MVNPFESLKTFGMFALGVLAVKALDESIQLSLAKGGLVVKLPLAGTVYGGAK